MEQSPLSKSAKRLYDKASELILSENLLHENQLQKPLNFWARIKLWRAARLLRKVLKIIPHSWRSMWLLGKTVQRLGKEREAFDWFEKAWDLKPGNADVAREASLSAMRLGLGQHAIEYCEEALRIEPDEPGLLCNLGLALLYAGQPQQAFEKVQEAVKLDANDKVTKNVFRVIQHITETKIKCPKNSSEMQRFCQKHPEIFK